MAQATEQISRPYDAADMDPGVARLLDRKRDRIANAGRYTPLTIDAVATLLTTFFAKERPKETVEEVMRVGGGASKEQFAFYLRGAKGRERFILRMDPIQTASETDRRREFEALTAYHGVVPSPRADWLDFDGKHFGQPAAIMGFIGGVTKPTSNEDKVNVTGIGTAFGPRLRGQLSTQFLGALAKIHNHDWRKQKMPSFDAPTGDPYQAARWQLNWWSRVWRDDAVQVLPIAALTERWLRHRLPKCDGGPVLIHGDFRTGNVLFDEKKGEITAILDWEYAHLGDFHEDLGWMLQGLYTTHHDGKSYVCGLYPKDSFIADYEKQSGRKVNLATLRWYEVLNAYKCLAITLATSVKAARDGHNHQDVMLSWLGPVGWRFATDLCDLMQAEVQR